jgi:hypothetical protein
MGAFSQFVVTANHDGSLRMATSLFGEFLIRQRGSSGTTGL